MELHRYNVGGLLVMMAHDAAARWNAGCPSRRDLMRSAVWIQKPDGTGDWLPLHKATNARRRPALAAALAGASAIKEGIA